MLNLTVVIVNFNTRDLTLRCLKSIYDKKWKLGLQVYVVDNNSTDGSVEAIKQQYPAVQIIENKENLGFSRANNQALKMAESEYYLILNSDTEVVEYALDNLIDFSKNGGFDIATCKLLNSDGTLQPNSGELPTFIPLFFWLSGLDDIMKRIVPISSYHAMDRKYYTGDRKVGWVGGTAMLVKREVFEKVGFLDENIFMYAEDVEFCLRAQKAGFRVGWTDTAEIIHLGGASSKDPKFNQWVGEFKGLTYIYRKYYGILTALVLKIFIYIFIILRALGFLILGRPEFTKTYAKVLIKI